MISDLESTSQIRIPGKVTWDQLTGGAGEQIYLGISILETDTYEIIDVSASDTLHSDMQSTEELEFFLRTLKERYEKDGRTLSVLIQPVPDAKMQRLIQVLDVCERLGIEKNINFDTSITQENS